MKVPRAVNIIIIFLDNTSTRVVGTPQTTSRQDRTVLTSTRLKIQYEDADGFKVFSCIEYDGEDI